MFYVKEFYYKLQLYRNLFLKLIRLYSTSSIRFCKENSSTLVTIFYNKAGTLFSYFGIISVFYTEITETICSF